MRRAAERDARFRLSDTLNVGTTARIVTECTAGFWRWEGVLAADQMCRAFAKQADGGGIISTVW